MNKYTIILNFRTETEFSNEEVKALFMEQWDQTAALTEGDSIDIMNVCRVVE